MELDHYLVAVMWMGLDSSHGSADTALAVSSEISASMCAGAIFAPVIGSTLRGPHRKRAKEPASEARPMARMVVKGLGRRGQVAVTSFARDCRESIQRLSHELTIARAAGHREREAQFSLRGRVVLTVEEFDHRRIRRDYRFEDG